MGSFGNKFRKARESKKLSFDDVSNVTKIGSRMLKAIEEEDFEQLPGGVFNKGFIRSYAKQLGIDPEDAVSDYLALLQAQVDSQSRDTERRSGADRRKPAPSPVPTSKSVSKTQNSGEVEEELPGLHLPRAEDIRAKPKEYLDRPSSGIPWLTIAIALVIVLAATLVWVRHSRRLRATKLVAPVVVSAESASSGPVSSAGKNLSSQPTASVMTSSAQPRQETAKLQNAKLPEGTRIDEPASDKPTSASPKQSNIEKPAGTDPVAKPAGSLTLVIRATENSWISVASDGQLVTQETLIAPAHTTIHGNREIAVRVGNAAGVTFSWKGQEIPAQGAEGEVKSLTFDAEGFHLAASSPN